MSVTLLPLSSYYLIVGSGYGKRLGSCPGGSDCDDPRPLWAFTESPIPIFPALRKTENKSTWSLLPLLLTEMPSLNCDSRLGRFRRLREGDYLKCISVSFTKSQLGTSLLAGSPAASHEVL